MMLLVLATDLGLGPGYARYELIFLQKTVKTQVKVWRKAPKIYAPRNFGIIPQAAAHSSGIFAYGRVKWHLMAG